MRPTPTSAIGDAGRGSAPRRRSAEHGFTLIELMVVVTMIALVSAAAVLAIPDPQGRVLDEAQRFAARTRAAQQQAIVGAASVSVWVTAGGYGFERRIAGTWAPATDEPFRLERWRDGTRVELPVATGRHRVTFDATGLADQPFDMRLSRGDASAVVRVDASGGVRADAG